MARSPLLLCMPLALACSDYSFKPSGDPNEGDTGEDRPGGGGPGDGGSSGTDDGTCDDETFPGDVLELNEACYVEYSVGSFTPVVEWRKTSWSVDPTSNNIMMAPIVVSLTDDNSDGLIDDQDVPDILSSPMAARARCARCLGMAAGRSSTSPARACR